MTEAEKRAREMLAYCEEQCATDGGNGGRFPNWTDDGVAEALGPLLTEYAVLAALPGAAEALAAMPSNGFAEIVVKREVAPQPAGSWAGMQPNSMRDD